MTTSHDQEVLSSGLDRAEKGYALARLNGSDGPVALISAPRPDHPGECAVGFWSVREELARFLEERGSPEAAGIVRAGAPQDAPFTIVVKSEEVTVLHRPEPKFP